MIPLVETFRGRRVLVTGHTGFKGSWLTWWLHELGAEVTGYALAPGGRDWMYEALNLDSVCSSNIADIRDRDSVLAVFADVQPHFVFHLAAQSLVLSSYEAPVSTIETNVMGTVNVLEALRLASHPVCAVVVTSDKCYENDGSVSPFRENDPLGGHDVYSMSKAATELVTASYRRSFFSPASPVRVASARAGNVVGGGDWAENRLVPDCIRALMNGQPVRVRNPRSIRPWQHVLEPLSGYLLLAQRIAASPESCEAWNFGPGEGDSCSVAELVERIVRSWGSGSWVAEPVTQPHEAATLRLSTEKAAARLGWKPRWRLSEAVEKTVEWYKAQVAGAGADRLRAITSAQISAYMRD